MKISKRIIYAVVTAIVGGVSANAQILYKVEKEDSDKVSYLLGTHHFAPLSVVDSISELPVIMNTIDKLYGELDMSAMNDPSAMMGIQQKLIAPADSTLDKVLTPAQLDSVSAVLSNYAGAPVSIVMLNGLKPAAISTQLAQLMAQRALPQLNPLEGIDMTMQTRAHSLGKPVAGLETMEFQMDMLYGRPISLQAKELIQTVGNAKEEEIKAQELSTAYLNHDIDEILNLMLTAEEEDPTMAERLIYSRNDNWVRTLAAEMPGKSLMVVVGAGHLPGPRGVIEGLRKAGFKIEAIR